MRCLLLILLLLFQTFRAQAEAQPVVIIMTVDWEGDDLRPANLQAMAALRKEFPKIPFLHYMNAAYFTKPGADRAAIRRMMQPALRPGDQFGVHIHGWKSLFEAAGVTHRTTPSWERGGRPRTLKNCSRDCGFEIPINAYTSAELHQVMRLSKRILSEQGFTGLKHFRAGGWVTSPELLEAAAGEGFVTDSSSVPVRLVADEMVGMDLLSLLRSYWPHITSTSQPYAVKTSHGSIWEVPNNAALADYMESKETLAVVQEALKAPRPGYVIAGFHQETADDWQDRVREFLRSVQKLNVTFAIMPEHFVEQK